jgi:hypothetical protein
MDTKQIMSTKLYYQRSCSVYFHILCNFSITIMWKQFYLLLFSCDIHTHICGTEFEASEILLVQYSCSAGSGRWPLFQLGQHRFVAVQIKSLHIFSLQYHPKKSLNSTMKWACTFYAGPLTNPYPPPITDLNKSVALLHIKIPSVIYTLEWVFTYDTHVKMGYKRKVRRLRHKFWTLRFKIEKHSCDIQAC